MGKHGPNRLANYQAVHDKVIRDLLDRGFLLEDSLAWDAQGDSLLTLQGALICAGEIRIEVAKELTILDGEGATALVQTVGYTYNAVLDRIGNILRYDSPHQSHNQFHHVHRYDVLAGDKEGVIHRIDNESDIPTLGEVIEELEGWYYDHYGAISLLRARG